MSETSTTPPTYETIPSDSSIELRALDAETDSDTVFSLVDANRPYLARYLPWAEKQTPDDTKAFIASSREKRDRGDEYTFGIFSDGELVGHISLAHLNDDTQIPEIGYWVIESVSGHGIITKAATAVTHFGLGTLKLPKILVRARPDNIASNRIAEKLGYKLVETKPNKDNPSISDNNWVIEASAV